MFIPFHLFKEQSGRESRGKRERGKMRKGGRERENKYAIFYLLVHSSYACDSQSWAWTDIKVALDDLLRYQTRKRVIRFGQALSYDMKFRK